MDTISVPTARAAIAEPTTAVLRMVASSPPMRAVTDCRTMMDVATEMANEVSHDVACVVDRRRLVRIRGGNTVHGAADVPARR